MIHNEAEAIREALSCIEGVACVTRGWPRQKEALPCIAISKAADTPMDLRDDGEHIAQLEYYIRVFAHRAQQADAIAAQADACMTQMGYTRVFAYDADDERVRMQALRYRKYV